MMTVIAAALAPLIVTSTAGADPSHNTFPPFRMYCTNGDSFLLSTGDIHNRSTQAFVVNDTNILVIRTLSIDGTLAFSRAAGASTRSDTTCMGTDSVGETILATGFVTPRS
jgi:hypothetical protein